MLDVQGLPPRDDARNRIFTCPTTVTNLQWTTWPKPRGVSMVFMMVIGGGGGGGGGFSDIAGNPRTGGAAGASSSITRVLIPASSLPDVLYVQVGVGGAGGGPAAIGVSGVLSFISVAPSGTLANVVVASGSGVAGPGNAGGISGNAGGGTAGAASALANMPLSGSGIFESVAGVAGSSGGGQLQAGFAATLPATGALCNAGGGGAGCTAADLAGGGVTAIAGSYVSEFAPAGPAAGSNNGCGGTLLWQPFWAYGGCGGSSSNAGIGGNGGPGAFGAGGGGGGAGTTGGSGGNGGGGLVVFQCW